MNFFRLLTGMPEAKKVQTVSERVVRGVAEFMQNAALPNPRQNIEIQVYNAKGTARKYRMPGRAQYYILVYGDEGQAVLNAGYLLKQGYEFLRSRKIPAKILLQVPDELAEQHCLGMLAVNPVAERVRESKKDSWQNHFLICQKNEEHWIDDVAEAAGKMLSAEMQTGVRIIRKEDAVHIAEGACFGRNRGTAEMHAGVVLGAFMAAAEELWIDLEMVSLPNLEATAGPDYLITICRQSEKEKLLAKAKEEAERSKASSAQTLGKDHMWRYA